MVKKEKIAYTIVLKNGRELNIRHSANAWWMEQHPVDQVLFALGTGSTIQEACDHAGITLKQYKYFAKLHPELRDICKTFNVYSKIRARATLRKALEEPKYALKYLEKKLPAEFGNPETVGNVENLMNAEWQRRKEDIRAIYQVRQDAARLKLEIPGFTNTDDPMPWDPKNHKKELERIVEVTRVFLRDMLRKMRVESEYVTP